MNGRTPIIRIKNEADNRSDIELALFNTVAQHPVLIKLEMTFSTDISHPVLIRLPFVIDLFHTAFAFNDDCRHAPENRRPNALFEFFTAYSLLKIMPRPLGDMGECKDL